MPKKKRVSSIERSIPTFVSKHSSRHAESGKFVKRPKATKKGKRT